MSLVFYHSNRIVVKTQEATQGRRKELVRLWFQVTGCHRGNSRQKPKSSPDCDLTQHCLRQETHFAAKNVWQELWKMLFAARQVYVVSFLTTAQEHQVESYLIQV